MTADLRGLVQGRNRQAHLSGHPSKLNNHTTRPIEHWADMPPSICLRTLSQLSLDASAHGCSPHVPRLLRPQIGTACLSTSATRYAAVVKKKGMTAAPKKGIKSLNTKKGKSTPGGDAGKRPGQGERKALRKRIILSNDNALHVSSLQDLDKANVLSEKNEGKVMGLPQEHVVDALRAVDAFKPNQAWTQDLVNAHTDYAPLPNSQPMQYTQDTYTANLLQQMLKSNRAFLHATKVSTKPDLPLPLPPAATLGDLVALGMANPEASWPVFVALWNELSVPGRPPVLLALDGLSHIMRHSEYMSAEVKPIHAHDLTLVDHFVQHLSGQKELPNGGMVIAATSQSNSPTSPALDFCIQAARARQTSGDMPQWNPYKKVDSRVMDALRDLPGESYNFDIINVGGLSKEEARSIMEYYAESGMLRHKVNQGFVTEKWSLAGMGNIGELEKASVRMRL
ncbi:mitochondrial ribosomal protein [Pyrenophora tritici-repentis]|uniref:Small ribosomal subunit protein mS29 n=1 Tax=Pyrenophora tritici-repentis TaxID=45151 RepID=A0A2W1DIV6_9PLEO|nr:mitochondrial ribosomal protein [Pyrenophora tritici-repentis]KAF7578908.1 putative mitochondrial ribosomal protein [Pyrenophora tritici-repentis]KAI0589831.1 mitochondrial ribosomal protein [Pyrenophora tritici-repentis]PZC97807.1 DAP3 domain containing protein [Pyrenophora tritici-repentis]